MPNVDVYVTGSNSKMLSKDIATNFRDRGFEIRVYPLSLGEYIEATGLDKSEAFDEYLIWGGMPMAALERNDAVRSKYLKDLFAKVYMKDIRERQRLKDDAVLERVADMLFSVVGSLTSPFNIATTLRTQAKLKTTDRTVKNILITLTRHSSFLGRGDMMFADGSTCTFLRSTMQRTWGFAMRGSTSVSRRRRILWKMRFTTS